MYLYCWHRYDNDNYVSNKHSNNSMNYNIDNIDDQLQHYIAIKF